MKIEFHTCDVCKEKLLTTPDYKPTKMQVIFTTEQDEGRSSKPYFSFGEMDLCKNCLAEALTGKYIHAKGAMGFNEYYFTPTKTDKQ